MSVEGLSHMTFIVRDLDRMAGVDAVIAAHGIHETVSEGTRCPTNQCVCDSLKGCHWGSPQKVSA